MSNIKKMLEKIDSMTRAASKPTGPKFPGYWKGTDPASKSRSKMVGGAEESIIKDLHNTAKKKVTEWSLEEDWKRFKEADTADQQTTTPPYTGIDPVVRQRTNMQPATSGEINNNLNKNPPVIKTGSGDPLKTSTGQPVQSGGQIDVAKAAMAAARTEPDVNNIIKPVTQSTTTTPVVPQGVTVTPIKPPTITHTELPSTYSATTSKATPTSTAIPKKVAPGSWQDVWKHNPDIKNPNLIYPDQRIKLPNSDEDYVVQKGDTLSKIAKMYRSGEIGGRVIASPIKPVAATAPSQISKGSITAQASMPTHILNQLPGVKSGNNPAALNPLPAETQAYLPKFKLNPPVQVAMKENAALAQRHDVGHFAKLLRTLENREQTNEIEDPAVNKQDPDSQTTSQTSPNQDPAAVKQQTLAQMQDVAVAKGTMSGLKSALGPNVDTNALSSAVTKISDNKPLSAPEATSMSALTPLIAKAAETPQTASTLKTALSQAAMLAKKGI